jgi:hypothetical protein
MGRVTVFEKERNASMIVIMENIVIEWIVYVGRVDLSKINKPFIEKRSNVINPANLLNSVAPHI